MNYYIASFSDETIESFKPSEPFSKMRPLESGWAILFDQYVRDHEGIRAGTHLVRTAKSGLRSIQKDPSYQSHARYVGPCENCGCDMHLKRNSKGQPFYGCSAFHRTGCRGTRRFEDPSMFSPGNKAA